MKPQHLNGLTVFFLLLVFVAANAQVPDELHKHDLNVHVTGPVKQIVERSFVVDKDGKRKYIPFGVRIVTFNESGYMTSESLRDTEEEGDPENGSWEVSSHKYRYDKDANLVQQYDIYTAEAYATQYRNRKVGQTFYRTGKSDEYYTKTVHRYLSDAKSQIQEFIYYFDDTTRYKDRIVYNWKGNKAYETLHYSENGKLDYKIEYERDQWGKELERKVIDAATNKVKYTTSTRYQFDDTWTNWTKMYKTFKEPGKPDETILYERHLEYYKNYDKPKKEDLFQYLTAKLAAGTGMDYWVSQENDSFQVTRIAVHTSGNEIVLNYTVAANDDERYEHNFRFNPKDIIGLKEIPTRLTDKRIIEMRLSKETYFYVRKSTRAGSTDLPKKDLSTFQFYVAPDIDVAAFMKALEDLKQVW